ncbi:MAG: hypothetical protein HY912_19945 [Desulfomonile tiedjei]|uniref:DUF2157 domain-containing protein n=1 Tax=Desulfomonile tiedjei TaxID=2358 RepID=A0A9D6V8A6_9BACT|nr:hypothetical protein [Desulfomonile tiedjei]
MTETGNDCASMSPEEAEARGLYFLDGRWITHAEAKELVDRHHISKDVRRLANYYYIAVGLVGIGIWSLLAYPALVENYSPTPGELIKLTISFIVCMAAVLVGIGLRKFNPLARRLGLAFYPAVMAGLFAAAVFAGQLEGQVLAALVLGLPLAISFGVLSYLTLYGEGAEKAFKQSQLDADH